MAAAVRKISDMREKEKSVYSTKKMLADEKVKRCENVKDITSYISRVDEMIERKRQLFSEE